MLFPTSAQVCLLGRRSFELNFNANISAFRSKNRMRHNIPSIGGTRKMRRRKEEIWTSPFPPHQQGGGVKVNKQAEEEEEETESTLFFAHRKGELLRCWGTQGCIVAFPFRLSIPSFLAVAASPTLPYGSSSECRQSWEEGGKRELGKRSFSLPLLPPCLQHSFAFFSQSFLALSFARQQQEEQSNQSNERGH